MTFGTDHLNTTLISNQPWAMHNSYIYMMAASLNTFAAKHEVHELNKQVSSAKHEFWTSFEVNKS